MEKKIEVKCEFERLSADSSSSVGGEAARGIIRAPQLSVVTLTSVATSLRPTKISANDPPSTWAARVLMHV